jgi:ABC-type amino acid transport system permease subunit
MFAELANSLSSDVVMGIGQAACAIVICLAVVLLCRRFAVHVERETMVSLARGLVQMVAVGVVLAVLLHGSLLIGALILLGMTFAAAATASRRAPNVRGALMLSFYAIAAGAAVVIAAMLATGTLTADIVVLVPVGSMIIANAMNACAQSMERFRADVTAHVGQIEAGLALGAGRRAEARRNHLYGPGYEAKGEAASKPFNNLDWNEKNHVLDRSNVSDHRAGAAIQRSRPRRRRGGAWRHSDFGFRRRPQHRSKPSASGGVSPSRSRVPRAAPSGSLSQPRRRYASHAGSEPHPRETSQLNGRSCAYPGQNAAPA